MRARLRRAAPLLWIAAGVCCFVALIPEDRGLYQPAQLPRQSAALRGAPVMQIPLGPGPVSSGGFQPPLAYRDRYAFTSTEVDLGVPSAASIATSAASIAAPIFAIAAATVTFDSVFPRTELPTAEEPMATRVARFQRKRKQQIDAEASVIKLAGPSVPLGLHTPPYTPP